MIDADSFHSDDDDSDSYSDDDYRYLPEPLALLLEPPVSRDPHNDMSFAALGTKIFALMNHRCGLAYDAEMGALSMGAHAPLRWSAAATMASPLLENGSFVRGL